MAITTVDQYIASTRQQICWAKTGLRTTISAAPFSVFEVAGSQNGGVLAGTSTTTGVVPDDTTPGCPGINFTTGTGYLTGVKFKNSVASTMVIYDILWKGGAYAFNAATSGNTPTSFLSKIPGGTAADTAGCTEIWVETVTAFTGNQTFKVTYTNEAGTTGRTTGATGLSPAAAPTLGRMWQLPLAAGDKGVSGVTGVTGATGTAGTANILVLRPLWMGRVGVANDGAVHGLDMTGMPIVFPTSALMVMMYADSTAIGAPWMQIEIAAA
jgi:hypothetical protein